MNRSRLLLQLPTRAGFDKHKAHGTHLLLKEMRMLLAFCGAYRLPMSRCSSAPLLWPTPWTGNSAGARLARGPARSFARVVRNCCSRQTAFVSTLSQGMSGCLYDTSRTSQAVQAQGAASLNASQLRKCR